MELTTKTQKNFKLVRLLIRVPKEHSAFAYFTLEANEGLCFYSTIESSLSGHFRDLELIGTLEFKDELHHLIDVLRQSFSVEILEEQELVDHELKK